MTKSWPFAASKLNRHGVTNVGVVVLVGISATVIFKSTSIRSYLAAIRPNVMLSWTKLSVMALNFSTVVVVPASIAST
jgi:hypothetical protein